VARHAHISGCLLETEVARESSIIDRYTRPVASAAGPPAAAACSEVPPVGGDHIGVEISDQRRAAEVAGKPVAERTKDRAVLPSRARARGPGGDPLGLAEQVARLELRNGGRQGRGRGDWPT
jgi:hypothetical protein